MRALGFFLSVLGIVFAIMFMSDYQGYEMAVFFDWLTIIVIAAIAAGVTLSAGNFKTLVSGINGAVSKKYKMTREQRDNAVEAFKLLKSTVTHASALMVFISLILIMLKLDDPASLGPKVGVAFLAVFYGIGINMLLINPAVAILKRKPAGEEAAEESESRSGAAVSVQDREAVEKLLQLCFEKGITRDEIMGAEEISLRS